MQDLLVKIDRLAGPEGDGRGVYWNEDGVFLGPGVALIEGRGSGAGARTYQVRPVAELERLFSAGYGGPVEVGSAMARFESIAAAMGKGSWSLAHIHLAHMRLPPLADAAAAGRLMAADRMLKANFDPNEPRDWHGRWTTGGGGAGPAGEGGGHQSRVVSSTVGPSDSGAPAVVGGAGFQVRQASFNPDGEGLQAQQVGFTPDGGDGGASPRDAAPPERDIAAAKAKAVQLSPDQVASFKALASGALQPSDFPMDEQGFVLIGKHKLQLQALDVFLKVLRAPRGDADAVMHQAIADGVGLLGQHQRTALARASQSRQDGSIDDQGGMSTGQAEDLLVHLEWTKEHEDSVEGMRNAAANAATGGEAALAVRMGVVYSEWRDGKFKDKDPTETLKEMVNILIGVSHGTRSPGGPGKLPSDLPKLPRKSYARAGDLMQAKEFQALPDGAMVDPGRIRTIQSSISAEFTGARPLQETIAGLKNGTVKPEDIPPIRLFVKNGKVYTLDHRRLVAAREAGVKVRVTRATEAEVRNDAYKFTGGSDGLEIVILKPGEKRR